MKIIFSGRNLKKIPKIHYNAIQDPSFLKEIKDSGNFKIKAQLNLKDKTNKLCFVDLENVPDLRIIFFKILINPIQFLGELKNLCSNPIKYFENILTYHLSKQSDRYVFIFEGKTNSKINHNRQLYKYFNKVFTWDKTINTGNIVHFYWPQPMHSKPWIEIPFHENFLSIPQNLINTHNLVNIVLFSTY